MPNMPNMAGMNPLAALMPGMGMAAANPSRPNLQVGGACPRQEWGVGRGGRHERAMGSP